MDIDETFAKHEKLIEAFVRFYGGKNDMMEDDVRSICYDIFLHVFDKFDPTRGTKFASYLVTSIKRRFSRIWREPKTKQSQLVKLWDDCHSEKTPMEDTVAYNKSTDAMIYEVEGLPFTAESLINNAGLTKAEKTIFVDFLGGKSRVEIEEERNITRQAVSFVYVSGLKKLQNLFNERYADEYAGYFG